jgi:predicted nucleic acid-binding protein
MRRTPPFSVDANVLIYCVHAGEPRQHAALEIMERALGANCILTLQALGEFFHAVSRKRIRSRAEAALQVRRWLVAFPDPVPSSPRGMDAAMSESMTGRFAYWDAMLLATAAEAGCTAVISEDMAPGATLGPVRIVPAFAGGVVAPEALALLEA